MVRRGRKRGGAIAGESRQSSQTTKKANSKKTKRTTTEPTDDKEDMALWNERIRYANALEFLAQQEQLLFAQDSLNEPNNTPLRRRLTRGMCHSLQHFQKTSLTCPLCHTIYAQPVTLSGCAHTFCKSCINDHVDDSWYCPIPTCKLPVSMKQEKRKFWNVNAAMQSVVASWSNICHTLMETDEDWWIQEPTSSKVGGTSNVGDHAKTVRPPPAVLASLRQPMEDDDDDDSSAEDDFATADEDDPVMMSVGPTPMDPPHDHDDDSVSLF